MNTAAARAITATSTRRTVGQMVLASLVDAFGVRVLRVVVVDAPRLLVNL